MADMLVIKVNMFCKPREMDNIRNYIVEQAKTGVVILPPYCEAQVVPDGMEIKIEDLKGEQK